MRYRIYRVLGNNKKYYYRVARDRTGLYTGKWTPYLNRASTFDWITAHKLQIYFDASVEEVP